MFVSVWSELVDLCDDADPEAGVSIEVVPPTPQSRVLLYTPAVERKELLTANLSQLQRHVNTTAE